MNSRQLDIFCIYSENDEGTLDELTVDVFNKRFDFIGNVDEEELSSKRDNKIKGFKVERDFFDYYCDLLKETYSGSYFVNESDYETRKKYAALDVAEEKAKPLIDRETVWKALRMELSENELSKVCSFDYRLAKNNYYDFDLFISKIHDVMKCGIDVSIFKSWCVIVMRCLEDCMDTKSQKLKALYYDIGDYFDGMAFMSMDISDEEKRVQCLEDIAWLKYLNHQVQDVKARKKTPFETDGVITYVTFGFSMNDGEECLMKACVVDIKNGKINYMIIPEFEYDERINYTFITDEEFDGLPSQYFYGYALDRSMTIDYAIKKRQ